MSMRLGFWPLREMEQLFPPMSTAAVNVQSRRASERKIPAGFASAPNRKWTNSTKLVLPAPLRD